MTDKELIQALRCDNGNCLICGLCDSCFNIDAEVADRLEALLEENEHLREATKMVPQWVSVSERLPETIPCIAGTAYSEAVNVLTAGRKVLTAIFDGTDFIADAEFWEAEGEKITHWAPVPMPLPEPPSTEGGGMNESLSSL